MRPARAIRSEPLYGVQVSFVSPRDASNGKTRSRSSDRLPASRNRGPLIPFAKTTRRLRSGIAREGPLFRSRDRCDPSHACPTGGLDLTFGVFGVCHARGCRVDRCQGHADDVVTTGQEAPGGNLRGPARLLTRDACRDRSLLRDDALSLSVAGDIA